MKTRSAEPEVSSSSTPEDAPAKLKGCTTRPPQVFVLPKNISSDARFVTLLDHATQLPKRYLYCPQSGIFELKKFTPPKHLPRSWLLSGATSQDQNGLDVKFSVDSTSEALLSTLQPGYALRDPSILIATPFDPIFLLLPLFHHAAEQDQKGKARPFLCDDDHIDRLAEGSRRTEATLKHKGMRKLLLERLSSVSSVQKVGSENFHKPDPAMLVQDLVNKATKIVEHAWAPSLEEEFVAKPLIMPTISTELHEEPPSQTEHQENGTPSAGLENPKQDSAEILPDSTISVVPEHITRAMRVRTALDLILSSYMSQSLRSLLQPSIDSHPSLDFKALDSHLETSQKLRKDAQALRSMSENISRKRNGEEFAEVQAEKKRKKEEEEKKRKLQSRALKDLKKADTSGMKKLSSFFVKKA